MAPVPSTNWTAHLDREEADSLEPSLCGILGNVVVELLLLLLQLRSHIVALGLLDEKGLDGTGKLQRSELLATLLARLVRKSLDSLPACSP